MENNNFENCGDQSELVNIPSTVIYRKNASKSFSIDSLLSNNDDRVEKESNSECKR